MIIAIPDKFLVEIESEKYFIRENSDKKRKKNSIFEEIDNEYINSLND